MSKQRPFLNLRSGIRGNGPPEASQIVIDGYRVERLIGVGPLTAVYAGILESHQQAVVLKVLLPHLAESEVFVQRFLQAANAARLVSHDCVLPCYDVGQSNNWVYLACELVEGDNLEAMAVAGSLERSRAIYVAWQMAMGLEAIHAAGLVHGNLRPSNVLIDAEDGVRLADLGLPALPDAESATTPASAAVLHLPPEALAAEVPPDQYGDIYAVGIILLGSLHGQTPFYGQTRQKLQESLRSGRTAIGQIPAGLLDADLSVVLARATATRPEDRYSDTWQLREDLERLQYQFSPIHARPLDASGSSNAVPREAGARSTRYVQEPAPRPQTVRNMRTWQWLTGAGALLAVVVGLGAAFAGGKATSTPAPPAPPVPPSTPVAPKPKWAAAAGTDAIGSWADLVCKGKTLRLRLIPAGNFWMGSAGDEAGRAADEDRHLVTLSRDFWLAETETTQAFYTAVAGTNPSHFHADDLPVETVSWKTVQDFLAMVGGQTGAPARLPSEAEWEYACRAGGGQLSLPGPDRAWTADSNIDGTRAVAKLKANAFGLYDMQGNVLEWVEDSYGRYHREAATDPVASGGVHRVMRGGAWNLEALSGRPSTRSKAMDVAAYSYLGFRIAITD